jgi:large subunit ribosomal protein L18
MRLFFRKKTSDKVIGRRKSKARIRKKISGTAEKPRLVVFKSTKNMYAQLIDDVSGKTLASASTLKVSGNGNRDAAKEVGKQIAEKASTLKIENVVFDRSGYVYHGRVQAVAEGAREAGLKF